MVKSMEKIIPVLGILSFGFNVYIFVTTVFCAEGFGV
jgi:hypothetical protein